MLTFDEVMPVKFGWTVGETNSKIDHLQFQPLNSFSDFVFTQQNMNLHLLLFQSLRTMARNFMSV